MTDFSSEPPGARRTIRSAHRLSSHSISFVVLAILLWSVSTPAFTGSTPARKQEARVQFEKAEQMREALNGRPESERTRRDYQRVADAYRKVYYVAPASTKADASVIAVAELLAEMGRQFQPGDKDLQSAIGQYEFLRKEYPGSKYRVEALFTIGQIYKEDLGDEAAARSTFQDFVKRYPHDQRIAEAKQALAELDQPKADQPKAKKAPVEAAHAKTASPATPAADLTETQAPTTPKKQGLQLVTGIRHWSSPDSTRVAIDVDGPVEYQAGRVPDPDRIFFDLPDTKLVSTLLGKSFDVQDGFLKKIRVAQYQRGSTRVVLEVDDVSEYSAFLLPNPYRLIIDIHGRQPHAQSQVAKAAPPESADDETRSANEAERPSRSIVSGNIVASAALPDATTNPAPDSKPSTKAAAPPATKPVPKAAATQADLATSSMPKAATKRPLPTRTIVDDNDDSQAASSEDSPSAHPATSSVSEGKLPPSGSTTNVKPTSKSTVVAKGSTKDPLSIDPKDARAPELKATAQPTTAPTAVAVAPRDKIAKKTTRPTTTEMATTREAAPTSAGDRSLTRALGLKIGRIVIDSGHGGHDTGTIGPNGLMEKDLVLDVALRLGRLLETRLGADVVYTRDDDTFIPLETRTAIANEQQADLFISVHANSSHDPSARGVETYYLNFTSSPDALEVAARENAVSEKSIHELQDLVKKITLKEKIEESHELASDVQDSLYSGLAGKNSTLRNRGVKKAPFVVLIGANMPSILAEISFVSNPVDEKKLEAPEYREKIAESLYKGIAKYAGGLSGVKVASKLTKEAGK